MPGTRRLTIALAGGAGSGKSTIARELAARLDGAVSSFGDYVRHLAAEQGEPVERSTLQRIGQGHVEADARAFVLAFLDWTSPTGDQPLIVDGVRHASVDDALRAWAVASNRDYVLILLDTSVHERAGRRHDGDEREIRKIDDHPVERETADTLPGIADLVVDGDGAPEDVIARIVAAAPEPIARRLQ